MRDGRWTRKERVNGTARCVGKMEENRKNDFLSVKAKIEVHQNLKIHSRMKRYINPSPANWPQILERPLFNAADLAGRVQAILDEIKAEGESAVRKYTEKFDGVALKNKLFWTNLFSVWNLFSVPKVKSTSC